MLWLFGIASGVLQAACYLPYVRDIVRGTTRPHRGTWAIWCTLSVIVLLSQRADGGRWSLAMAAAQGLGTFVIVVMSLGRGVGGTSRFEIFLLVIAAAGVVGWYAAGDPTVATVCVIVSDMLAVAMMVPKTFADPYSETLSAFLLSMLSAMCALLAVGALDFGLIVYPAYLICADAVVVGVMVARRPQIAA